MVLKTINTRQWKIVISEKLEKMSWVLQLPPVYCLERDPGYDKGWKEPSQSQEVSLSWRDGVGASRRPRRLEITEQSSREKTHRERTSEICRELLSSFQSSSESWSAHIGEETTRLGCNYTKGLKVIITRAHIWLEIMPILPATVKNLIIHRALERVLRRVFPQWGWREWAKLALEYAVTSKTHKV